MPYAADGSRFLGATLDPAPLYRLNAVQRWLDGLGVTVAAIHAHVGASRSFLVDRLDAEGRPMLVPGVDEVEDRGHFLTFRRPDAGDRLPAPPRRRRGHRLPRTTASASASASTTTSADSTSSSAPSTVPGWR